MTQFQRYILNGILASLVHFSVLTFNIEILQMTSAGSANTLAATFGIATSFCGSRFFVFRGTQETLPAQALKFILLYGVIAVVHGIVLFVWSDLLALPYAVGFLIATAIQFAASYTGNKLLVFKQ